MGYRDMNWEKVFRIPYQCTKSTQIQSLQFRILNRYIPTKRYLYIRNLTGSSHCDQCEIDETLEHFFYQCPNVSSIWVKIFIEIDKVTNNNVKSVLFGINEEQHSVNLIILLVKQYFLKCRLGYGQVEPNFEGARSFVKHHVMVEKHAAIANKTVESFKEKWQGVTRLIGSNTLSVPFSL